MNKLEHILKQLRRIEPDGQVADRSFYAIINTPRNQKVSWLSFTVFRAAEYGAAMALVVMLLFFMGGNASLFGLLSPIQSNSLNPGGLRAEAEAIDIQIKLLGIDYEESSSTTTTATTPTKKKVVRRPAVSVKNETSSEEVATTTPPRVEDVLKLLAE